jgi:DNA-binding response OmpR family regulator
VTEAPKTILVVDDEPDTLTYLRTVLEDQGYKTIGAVDGEEAIASLQEQVPDLVTLDITMPEKSGVAVYRKLREESRYSSIPVIMITGVSDDFKRFISTRRQVPPPDAYISKPVDHEEVIKVVEELLVRISQEVG